jgi:hypothetical protein
MKSNSGTQDIENNIFRLSENRIIISKRDAIDFFKSKNFKDIDIFSEKILNSVYYCSETFLMSSNFGALSKKLFDHCKQLLKTKKEMVVFWPKMKTEIPEKIIVFLMDPIKNQGILVQIKDINLLKTN